MDGPSESKDPLVENSKPESLHANVNLASDTASDHHSSTENIPVSSNSPVATTNESSQPRSIELQLPNKTSSIRQDTIPEDVSPGLSDSRDTLDDVEEAETEPINTPDDEVCNLRNSTPPPPPRTRPQMSHSRGASQVSSCGASVGRISGAELCHSRGASTDGSTMDAYTYSATESRRGTYSEAGTLPIGSTVIEENMQSWEQASEKKLSTSEQGQKSYVEKLKSKCTCCQSILRRNYQLPEHPTYTELLKYAFTCPPHGKVGDLLIWLVTGFAFWGTLISITGYEALPGGNLFSLIILYILAILGGKVAELLSLPSLLGCLIVGILLKSIPGVNVIGNNIDFQWSAALRSIALCIILIRAGLGLDPVALKKLSLVVVRLAFSPCLVEAISSAIAVRYFLDLPWTWGFMLGFILGAVSPAVVVPSLLKLQEDGYGVDKGIPTLVIAAASIDDVLAISGFSVLLGITFAEGSMAWTIAKGPIEIVVGIIFGIVFGIVCWYIPYKDKKSRPVYKLIVLLAVSCLALFGSQKLNIESAGAIAVLTVAFVAGLGWRKPGREDPIVEDYYKTIWGYVMPLMFSLIGSEIDILAIEPSTIGWGLLTLLICLTLRVITSFFVVMGADFTIWERLFIAIAWLPKATVQAAIGSKALDKVRLDNGSDIDIRRGQQVVTIAVMVILVTAPLGAAAIKLTGPKFLGKKEVASRTANDSEATV